ncbi:MAG: redoxin domain-containing protein [Bacteroidales bacterium]|nr:redoxin domain-containing protein [Bacteroidales bacterium]
MRNIFILILLFVSGLSQAQNTIDGTLPDFGGKKIFLMSIYGEKLKAIDSTTTDTGGHFSFTIINRLPGMYRVFWNKEGFVDLVWNQEDVKFTTSSVYPEDSLQIFSSLENKINLTYSKLDRINQSKLQLLMPVVDYYPVKDAFYALAKKEMEGIQKSQQRYLDSLAGLYPNSFAVRMAKAYQTPFIPAGIDKEDRINLLRQHYFDRVDFSDTALLRSMVFVNKAIAYLSLYSNNRLPQKQLEAEFIKAVTLMLGAASVSPVIYKFWLDYLVGGFDKYHFDEVITYIADNFQDPSSCEDQERKSALQKKLDTFKKIALGKIAPEMEAPDVKGKLVRLSEIRSPYTLVMFYATTCPHCVSMTPRLKELYDNQRPKQFEVMAVSIDTSRNDWINFIKEQKLNWINVSDLNGFGSKSADDFNIYATPTMFLLDAEKKILAKPISLMELEQSLRDFNLVR